MPKSVFHTLHIVVDKFPDSMEEELKTTRNEDEPWHGLKLVHDINIYRQGNGILAAFFDEDKSGDLQQRMETLIKDILSSRQRIIQIGYWAGTSLADIRRKDPSDPTVRRSEIKFVRPAAAAA